MRWITLAFACAVLSPALARAQGSDKVAAEALFAEGRRLMSEGRLEEACPKFEASQKMDPGVGTLLNLAECYEQSGRTASAWAQFREAISLARATGSSEREQLARERAAALEKRLSRLTISVKGGVAAGLEVRRNGVVLDPAELGIAIPVDPGKHTVTAVAEGREEFSTTVEVTGDNAQAAVEIPELAERPPETPAATLAVDSSPPAEGASSQKTLAAIAAGLGVAGLAVGGYFGLQASGSWDDAKGKCANYPYECGAEGKQLEEDARAQATWSTVGFGAGLAFLTVGAVLWFTAGPSDSTAVGLGPSGAVVKGSF